MLAGLVSSSRLGHGWESSIPSSWSPRHCGGQSPFPSQGHSVPCQEPRLQRHCKRLPWAKPDEFGSFRSMILSKSNILLRGPWAVGLWVLQLPDTYGRANMLQSQPLESSRSSSVALGPCSLACFQGGLARVPSCLLPAVSPIDSSGVGG